MLLNMPALLFKSPKTISNTFKKISGKTPFLQFIQEAYPLRGKKIFTLYGKGTFLK